MFTDYIPFFIRIDMMKKQVGDIWFSSTYL